MLSAVRTPCRRATTKSLRSFATAVDAAGLKIAAVDNGQPCASVTFLVKAGSRHEAKAGLAHALKNYAFKNTADRSALRIARETELYGGVLSSSLGREHLALTAEFLKGDEEFFVDVLSKIITSTRYTPHEFHESVLPSVQAESTEAAHSPSLTALDAAHALAFRKGLGSSLFASPAGPELTSEDVKSFASHVFTKSGVSVFGTGIEPSLLSKLVEKSLGGLAQGSSVGNTGASKYFGGESRMLIDAHGQQTLFIGYGTPGPVTPELSVLAAHLSAGPAIPWVSNDERVSTFHGLPKGASVQTVLLPYSDATLFGFLVSGPTSESVTAAGKTVVGALKEATGSIKADAYKRAVAKAKFNAATAVDTRAGMLEAVSLGLLRGESPNVQSVFKSIDAVSAQGASQALSKLAKSKPVYVAVGDVHSLPYADEVGL
ncbi:hypothetical protein M408DRAFT_331725 [Serendipita vermifera MAFF 305830]|uniref:Cytochrome b-c1 complex subunit 2, mitochondrial n=1 Tax=Serendipita vermifera MAFF 305830 TaxID=933852 RepID=A0A0C2WDA5_SERVB|nr:hypothetical protein M408DRAFT_331725 [Serendipita vermifera MAFF 305830]